LPWRADIDRVGSGVRRRQLDRVGLRPVRRVALRVGGQGAEHRCVAIESEVAEKFGGRPVVGDHSARGEDEYLIADVQVVGAVRDDQHRAATVGLLTQQPHDVQVETRIQPGGRLVE